MQTLSRFVNLARNKKRIRKKSNAATPDITDRDNKGEFEDVEKGGETFSPAITRGSIKNAFEKHHGTSGGNKLRQ